jgi:5-(carboxyamino)imidazole ribonucleotide synthase
MQYSTSHFKLGIIAGGQLGKMLIQVTNTWDIKSYVLDPANDCSCSTICTKFFQGDYTEYNVIYNFGRQVDMLTYEIENINVDALIKLKEEGLKIFPDPEVLKIIQNKGLQKAFYKTHSIPSSSFELFKSKKEIVNGIQTNNITYPFVQKLCTQGYDGRGVAVINSENDLNKLLEGESIVEEKVKIKKELSVIVARNQLGEVKAFPAVEMEFNSNANLVERIICPASMSENVLEQARLLAEKVIVELDIIGLLAVEMFIDEEGKLLVNEVAPRPHNSGHHTIECAITSQYEQHLRAILNLPLGDTSIIIPSVMLNILGEQGYSGKVKIEGMKECMAIPGVKIHIYGKKDTKPNRKMGHVTIIDKSLESAMEKGNRVSNLLKIKAWN